VQEPGDRLIRTDDVCAVVLEGDRAFAQPGVERVGIGAMGRVEDLREQIRETGGRL
jgi:hypothetical protein